MKNIKCLISFRVDGNHVEVGEVISKSTFKKKSDWQNLCHMTPARAEETDAAVGKPKKAAKKATAEPAAGSGLPAGGQ